MTNIDPDIANLIEEVSDGAEEDLLYEILEWEAERVALDRRHGKNEAMENSINKYLDRK